MRIIPLFLALIVAACAISKVVSYAPPGTDEHSWQINVEKSTIGQRFTVTIDDSTVIQKSAALFTGSLQTQTTYKGYEVKLLVTHLTTYPGYSPRYEATVFVNNDEAAKFTF
ncbi:MAG: hypothetical protein FJ215_01155 [Ignavibacteria bacterium]|nr:hypothetical protein [Ignavibacteria bacterium]